MNKEIFTAISLVAPLMGVAAVPQKMNVVLIMADDMGYECLKVNGGESYESPNIDKFAEQSMRFTNCHSNPLSTPSRVQIMTGKYNIQNYVGFGLLRREETTFGNIFQSEGYATCIAGKWQLGTEADSPQHFGFDYSCLWQHTKVATRPTEEIPDDRYANPVLEYNGVTKEFKSGEFGPDLTCDYVVDFIDKHKDEPFFVYYPMILTHCPFVPTPDSEDWEEKRSPTYNGDPAYYSDMLLYADKLIGRILDELERAGVADNTLVIFTGDNGTEQTVTSKFRGEPYKGGKGLTIDAGTHVPLIVRHPQGKSGVVNENLVDFTDMLPTICQAANIDISDQESLDGISFYSQLLGKRCEKRESVYCWYSPGGSHDKAAIFARTTDYKLYNTGKFFNVKEDQLEKSPLDHDHRTAKQRRIQTMLQEKIDQYNH